MAELTKPLTEQKHWTYLIVDDDPVHQLMVKKLFQAVGQNSETASSGDEGIELANSQSFDAILMDISMPGKSGVEATKAIRTSSGPNRKSPIFATTAGELPQNCDVNDLDHFSGLLEKPVRLQSLCKALGLPLDQTATGASAKPENPYYDEAQVNDLIAVLGRRALSSAFVSLCELVENELPLLLETPNAAIAQKNVHNLIGACGVLGATKLCDLLRDVERLFAKGRPTSARQKLLGVSQLWRETRFALAKRILQ